jgi:hypothetical protein
MSCRDDSIWTYDATAATVHTEGLQRDLPRIVFDRGLSSSDYSPIWMKTLQLWR